MSGRIRTIKPEWLDDELLAAAPDEARVLSVALILMADDHGRGRGSVPEIAMAAWRYDMARDDGANASATLAKASRALAALVEMRFVTTYRVAGQTYFAIRNWPKHQRVDHPSKPRIPEPPAADSASIPTLASVSRGPREDTSLPSRVPRARSGPPTSDQDPDQDQERDRRDSLASAWRKGYVRRFERRGFGTHGGPAGGELVALIDAALLQPDPEAFVERALDGFFDTPRMATVRPRFATRYLAEDPVGYAACATTPTGTTEAGNAQLVAGIPRLQVV